MAKYRQPIDQRIRRHVRDLAEDMALRAALDPESTRTVTGTGLHAGEFTRREAIRCVRLLGRNEGRARQVIREMEREGDLRLTRTAQRGRCPWRIYRSIWSNRMTFGATDA